MESLWILSGTALALAGIHTLLGPDHYLPFLALARANRWTAARTLAVTAACGAGHVLSSVLLGIVGIGAGMALSRLQRIESLRGVIASYLLIGFGLAYAVWGLRQARRARRHSHPHAHADGTVHDHPHAHALPHRHLHLGACPSIGLGRAPRACEPQPRSEEEGDLSGRRRRATPDPAAIPGRPEGCGGAGPSASSALLEDVGHRLRRASSHPAPRRTQRDPSQYSGRLLAPGRLGPWLMIVFGLGPCEPLIPLLMFPAAVHGPEGVVVVSAVFGVTTVAAMLACVGAGIAGLDRLPGIRPAERFGHVLAGVAIAGCGIAVRTLGL